MGRTGEAVERLEEIMRTLRAEGGCPWDRAQDIRTLRPYLVEETYEVLDEMDRVGEGGPWRALCEELGDLLFQIVFHAQLARELGEFALADVATAISDKIVSRHPHVFEGRPVRGAEEVLQNWARIKAEERRRKHGREGSVLDGVPSAAPALLRAERLTEKASRIGFDWPDLSGVRAKLTEELEELERAIASKDARAVEHELGDVLFSLANLARFTATPAEDALRAGECPLHPAVPCGRGGSPGPRGPIRHGDARPDGGALAGGEGRGGRGSAARLHAARRPRPHRARSARAVGRPRLLELGRAGAGVDGGGGRRRVVGRDAGAVLLLRARPGLDGRPHGGRPRVAQRCGGPRPGRGRNRSDPSTRWSSETRWGRV